MVFISDSSQPETPPESDPKPAPMASESWKSRSDIPLPPKLKWTKAFNYNKMIEGTSGSKADQIDTNPSQQLTKLAKLSLHEQAAQRPEPKSSNGGRKETNPVPTGVFIFGQETQKPKSTAPEKKSKLCIRLRGKEKAPVVEPEPEKENERSIADLAAAAAAEEDEGFQKSWNLRPRRPVRKANGRTGALKTGAPLVQPMKTQQAARPSGTFKPTGKNTQKKKNNLNLDLELNREEIEHDFLIMTGNRPPRRSKKRPKNMQKLLDHLFPGLWLRSISPDYYEVPDETPKRT